MTNHPPRGFLPGLLSGLIFVMLASGVASGAAPQAFTDGCNNDYTDTSGITRVIARDYAYTAVHDGYQWGGGCWDDNDVDAQPSDPPEQYTGGEGGDCSGLTFKSWYEKGAGEESDPGQRYHFRMQNAHGPYTAAAFKAGDGAANITVDKSETVMMDAFASSGHIGMIYQANTAAGQDRIVEAKSEADGTFTWPRTYRGDPSYSGVRRTGWAG